MCRHAWRPQPRRLVRSSASGGLNQVFMVNIRVGDANGRWLGTTSFSMNGLADIRAGPESTV